jgi:hypothetical protein
MQSRPSKHNPPQPGAYMVRYQWLNKMNGRQFDEWNIRMWSGEKWNMFSGAKVIEWRSINENT